MSELPRITLITPSFNQGQYIEETFESVLSQGYPNLEYMVVDGGSKDNSVEIIKKYERHFAWWVSEKDRGHAHALNKGFERGTGDIYAFINSDDLLEPGCLKAVVDTYLSAGGGETWVAGAVRCFGEGMDGQVKFARTERHPSDWLGKNFLPQQGSFWPAATSRRVGLFREDLRYVFDYEYWLRLRLKGGVKPVPLNQVVAAFRFHKASKTVSEAKGFLPELSSVRAEFRAAMPLPERLRSRAGEFDLNARLAQTRAIRLAQGGERGAAMKQLLVSVVRWPPLLASRRTFGALRRVIGGRSTAPGSGT